MRTEQRRRARLASLAFVDSAAVNPRNIVPDVPAGTPDSNVNPSQTGSHTATAATAEEQVEAAPTEEQAETGLAEERVPDPLTGDVSHGPAENDANENRDQRTGRFVPRRSKRLCDQAAKTLPKKTNPKRIRIQRPPEQQYSMSDASDLLRMFQDVISDVEAMGVDAPDNARTDGNTTTAQTNANTDALTVPSSQQTFSKESQRSITKLRQTTLLFGFGVSNGASSKANDHGEHLP